MTAPIAAISDAESDRLAASIQPSTWRGLRAPTIAPVTPGHASVQATATAATLVWRRSAMPRIASATARFRASAGALKLSFRDRQSLAGSAAQQAGLHRAIDDHTGPMRGAPGQFRRSDIAPDGGERWLQRIDMAQRLGDRQLRDIMVRQADGRDLALALEVEQRLPIGLEWRSIVGRPVHLVEIDMIDPQPAQRLLEFATDAGRGADAARHGVAVRRIRHQAAFREHIRTLALRNAGERFGDDLFGMAEAIDCGGVDPINAARHGMADGGNRVPVVLVAPAHGPIAADRPGAEAHPGNVHVGPPELADRKRIFG